LTKKDECGEQDDENAAAEQDGDGNVEYEWLLIVVGVQLLGDSNCWNQRDDGDSDNQKSIDVHHLSLNLIVDGSYVLPLAVMFNDDSNTASYGYQEDNRADGNDTSDENFVVMHFISQSNC
jgi:hypothetical protein